MQRFLLFMAVLVGPLARAGEPAPPPRPIADPEIRAVHAFAADLRRGDVPAAHARVKSWTKPFLADRKLFARYWEQLVHCHGPVVGIESVGRDGRYVAGMLRFQRQTYLLVAGDRLTELQLVTHPIGSPVLMRASHGVPVTAADPSAPAAGVVTFAVPGLHADQVPISLTLRADPPAAMKGFKLRKRDDGLNWLCEATVNPGKTGAVVFWESAVLVRGLRTESEYGGRPPAAKPDAPPEAARWLRPTACVQSDDPGIVAKAAELWAKKPDIGEYADTVVNWVSANEGTGKPFLALDAKTALGCGGSCTSRANLAAALFRARGIPARTVAHLPAWSGPLYVHWLVEYWHPGGGWQMVEPSQGTAWVDATGLVVLNVATPEDEDESDWPNRRSGVMAGAPRLSSRELDGPIRTPGVMGNDLRTYGLALPLADLGNDEFRHRFAGIGLKTGLPTWAVPRLGRIGMELTVGMNRLDRAVSDLPGRIQDALTEQLWAAARAAHPKLTVNDPRQQARTAAAQDGGMVRLLAALRE